MNEELAAAEVPYETVPVGAPIRSNITITEPDGITTKINAPGAPLGPEHVDAVAELLVHRGADASWVVLGDDGESDPVRVVEMPDRVVWLKLPAEAYPRLSVVRPVLVSTTYSPADAA